MKNLNTFVVVDRAVTTHPQISIASIASRRLRKTFSELGFTDEEEQDAMLGRNSELKSFFVMIIMLVTDFPISPRNIYYSRRKIRSTCSIGYTSLSNWQAIPTPFSTTPTIGGVYVYAFDFCCGIL